MPSSSRADVAARNDWRVAVALAVIAFATGCSTVAWRSLELGDVLGVRGQTLFVAGEGRLEGSVGWALGVKIGPQLATPEVRRAWFSVGTASQWTLHGAFPDGMAWPEALEVAGAVWDIELAAGDRVDRYVFDLEAGQALTQIEPCGVASTCTYAFTGTDAHRDVFAFEVAAGSDPSMDAWLDAVERGIVGRVSLVLYVSIAGIDGPLPMAVLASIPLAPFGATVEFRP